MNTNLKLVSIIVPVYNVEKYIERCIKSIQAQTYSNIEIIIVDDGSPDRAIEICEELKQDDDRIKIVTKSNGGLASARNVGLKNALGDYIACVDSDDWVEPNYIENLVHNIEKHKADLSVCDFFLERANHSFFNKQKGIEILNKEKAMEYACLERKN